MEFPRRPDMSDNMYFGVNSGFNTWENYPVFPTRLKKDDNLGLADAVTSSILSTGNLRLLLLVRCLNFVSLIADTGLLCFCRSHRPPEEVVLQHTTGESWKFVNKYLILSTWNLWLPIFQIGGVAMTGGLVAAVEERLVFLS